MSHPNSQPGTTPDRDIARAFGVDGEPACLAGGSGGAWRVADLVLKPANNRDEANWIAEILSGLPDNPAYRIQRPVKSPANNWIENGFSAWQWLPSQTIAGHFTEKIAAATAFHHNMTHVHRPDFLDVRDDPWSRADRVAWGEAEADYPSVFMDALNPLLAARKPVSQENQLIHGDLSGNFVLSKGESPGIIDMTPYWRPAAFALAIMMVDTVWDQEPLTDFATFSGIPEFRQMVLRALIRRIAEQAEQMRSFGKSAEIAMAEALRYVDNSERLLQAAG